MVTQTSIAPYDEKEYARKLFDNWRIDKVDKNNGVLVLLVIKERRWRIETGSGMKNILSDQLCEEIGNKYMVPYFKTGKYGEGLYNGVSEIAKEANIDLGKKQNRSSQFNPIFPWLLFLGAIGLGILIVGVVTRCPECHKLFVRRKKYREEVDRSEGYMQVDRHRDHRDPNGKLIKQETWQETVPAVNVTYLTHYKCRNCHHEWAKYSTAQYEK